MFLVAAKLVLVLHVSVRSHVQKRENWETGKKCSTKNMNENGELDVVDSAARSRKTSARRPLDSDEEEIADGLRGFRKWNRTEI